MFKSPNRPPGDYRLWLNGCFKDGIIGYGVVIMPGYQTLSGSGTGESPKDAELLALEKALEAVPSQAECVIYTDYKPLIRLLSKPEEQKKRGRRIIVMYSNDNDVHHAEARQLAERARRQAAATRPTRR